MLNSYTQKMLICPDQSSWFATHGGLDPMSVIGNTLWFDWIKCLIQLAYPFVN